MQASACSAQGFNGIHNEAWGRAVVYLSKTALAATRCAMGCGLLPNRHAMGDLWFQSALADERSRHAERPRVARSGALQHFLLFAIVIAAISLHQVAADPPWVSTGVWRNGSASDSRSEGWEFESLCPHCVAVWTCLWRCKRESPARRADAASAALCVARGRGRALRRKQATFGSW